MADAESRDGTYNYKTLLCTNIPELFLDKFVARTHFGRFGNLVNFVLRPRRMTCTVSYATEEEAELALHEGHIYNGHEFQITYAERETSPAQKTEQWVDPDVQAELSALSSGWKSVEYSSTGKSVMKPLSSGAAAIYKPPAALPTERRERAPSQFKAAKQELESLMRRPAYTSEEKYRVLDARDKWMRLNQQQQQDNNQLLPTAGQATQGYCPDMCPEKERVLREFQRQVAVYELQENSDDLISHKLAIKQYSRSSADQETPLPHELRAEPALHMTMCYLMHEIMDLSEHGQTPIGDWFHFVWDRTRSIRKEITQQELCSLSAVKLVEQCARFHIHCAARLVAEDPSVFDSKINAENLTKCLQTLKYMYHDLRLKGVQCPREAEFRGYIVLLNLADANFLWDIGQLPVELQNCAQVRQAIKFYLALQDTNIVRFFQLLRERETSYLSACILVTYFTRLRVLGLHRLSQAYRAPRKHEISSLPLAYISKLLGFPPEQEDEAAYFLQHYGLEITESARVILTRIDTPEADYKLKRQLELVESKRQQSVGECICGETLPPATLYRNHRPHNSFNEQGYLQSSAWTAKDQMPNAHQDEAASNRADEKNVFKVPMNSIKMKLPPPAEVGTMTSREGEAKGLKPSGGFGGFSFTQTLEKVAASKVAPANTTGFSFTQAAKEKPMFNFMAPPSSLSSSSPLVEQQQQTQQAQEEAKLAALQQAIAAAKQRQMELVAKRQEENAIQKQKQAEAKAEAEAEAKAKREQQQLLQQQQQLQRQRQEAEAEAERQRILREAQAEEQRQMENERKLTKRTETLYQQLIEENLNKICLKQLRLHEVTVQSYHNLLDNLIQTLAKQSYHQHHYELGLMRHYWQRWRRYRRCQRQKDSLIQSLPLHFEASPSEDLVDAESAEEPLRLMRRYRQGEPCNYRQLLAGLDEQCWLKLDLWQLLSKALPQLRPGARRFYKLVISLPAGSIGDQLEYQLDRGLLQHPLADSGDTKADGRFYILGLAQGIALSVVKLRGQQDHRTNRLIQHANGLVCLGHAQHLSEAKQRFHSLAEVSGCPYMVLIMQQTTAYQQQKDLIKQLYLEDLKRLKEWRFFSQRPGRSLMQTVQLGITFLASQPFPSCGSLLQQVESREFIVNHLGLEFFQRLRQDCFLQQLYQKSPQFCQQVYNEAVRRLQLVAGEDLSMMPQLPSELVIYVEPITTSNTTRLEHFSPNWQSIEARQKLVQILEDIKLPTLSDSPDPSQLCTWLLDYAQLSQSEDNADTIAMQSMQMLVNGAEYLDVIELWATERLKYILGHNEKQKDSVLPRCLVYKVSTLKTHFQNPWFFDFQQSNNHNFKFNLNNIMPASNLPLISSPTIRTSATSPSPSLNELDFHDIVGKAMAVLERSHLRQERQTLRDLNGTQSREKEQEWNDPDPKRQRLTNKRNYEN
ncbi:LOW QUALITY PROTEIN: protein xmas [Drosophila tropicalis]|uniref:LOW QUALITY PROTEIN: protein xmas n=1 Tax=Drosophila tropicalis TaxID=46794 RepID=UPI0035AB9AC0